MASTIAATTGVNGALIYTADASGNLSLLSGATTIVAITNAGAAVTGVLSVGGAPVASTTNSQNQTYTAFTTGGTSSAYTLTPTPALTAYATGQRFNVTLNAAPGALPTLNISGLGVKNFKYYNAQGTKVFIDTWAAQANWISDVIYDGTDMVLMNPIGRAAVVVASTQKAIFGYGSNGSVNVSMTNLVSNTGSVSNDVTGVGTTRESLAAAGYGTDKAIFGYGAPSAMVSMTNLVSNTGVVGTDVTGVGTSRQALAAAGYGTDKAIFGYGNTGAYAAVVSMTNLVSNTGVVATDVTGVGTGRGGSAAAGYGTDKAIFGYGWNGSINLSMTNLVSNTGVVSTDITGVGTARRGIAAAGYGTDKAIFGGGYVAGGVSMTNLVSNTGVVSTDVTGVGTASWNRAAAGYGTDKAIFGYGQTTSITNLVSNTGVVSTDVTGVGTARYSLAAAGFSLT